MNDNESRPADGIDRRAFVTRAIAAGVVLSVPAACTTETRPPAMQGSAGASGTPGGGPPVAQGIPANDELFELTVAGARERMEKGTLTSHALTQRYLTRIEAMDKRGPAVNAVIELNPEALSIADSLDAERKAGKVRGPLPAWAA